MSYKALKEYWPLFAKWCGKAMVQTTPADSPRREVDRGTAGCDIHI